MKRLIFTFAFVLFAVVAQAQTDVVPKGLIVSNFIRLTKDAIATVSTDGLVLQNTTAALVGATVQMSPRLKWTGTGWSTNAGGSSRTISFFAEALPATGASDNLSGFLKFGYINGASSPVTTYPLILNSDGTLVVAAGGGLLISSRLYLYSGASGTVTLATTAADGFTRLNLGPATSAFPGLATTTGTVPTVTVVGGDGAGTANLGVTGQILARESFSQPHLVRLATTFAAKGIADTNINAVLGSPIGIVTYREEQTKSAGNSSWKDDAGYLDIKGDATTDNEGVDIAIGDGESGGSGRLIVGSATKGWGCFEVNVTLGDNAGTDNFYIGWRQAGAFVDGALIAGYTEYAVIGINNVSGRIFAAQEIANVSKTDDSGVNWGDGETRTLKACIASTGIPTLSYTASGGTTYTQVTQANIVATQSAVAMIPFIQYLSGSTTSAAIKINWMHISK